MPEISRFYGIVIKMCANDHPPPHFHALYGSYAAVIEINPIRLYDGKLPPRALSFVFECAAIHQRALMANWNALRSGRRPRKLAPLA